MNCPSCDHANPDAARFCNGCGAALAPRCPGCGADNPPGSRFCNACGAALAAPSDPDLSPEQRRRVEGPGHGAGGPGRRARSPGDTEARKVVTIVFADLIGSTSLHERLDPESARRLMDRYYRALQVEVEAHGGTVVKLLGDGVMAAFGVPRVAEDDAIRAVHAAAGMQRVFREQVAGFAGDLPEGEIGLRVAVNTGEVVVSADHTDVIGDPVNVAARLQQEARDGDVLIGESTERLVAEKVTLEPFGVFQLKGRAERVAAYRVVSLERPAGVAATPFVGRDDELRRLEAIYDAAVAAPAARLVVILGSPGLGKSRLLDELGRRLDGATVLRAQCEAAGGATFAPLAAALREWLAADGTHTTHGSHGSHGTEPTSALEALLPEGADRTRIGDGIAALLAGTPALPEETFFVVRRFLAGLAATRPVMLAIDDLQWAEPLLLDLIEHLVQWGSGTPLLVLAAARPDLRDRRSSLATPGGVVSDVITLAGLDAAAATRLAADVIGAAALPAAVAGRVLASSEGNPLFVSELVRMLVNDGALKREGDRWTAAVDLAALEMPPTIQALLAARIERLRPEDRLVLERAAIVGRQFSRAAVANLLPREITDLDTRLEGLRRSELVEPDAGWFLGEPALRFHHGLTRDAAYRRVLKGTRAELHGRCAEWIEGRVGDTVEHEEMIGWHLEQAHQHLRELGPIDERGRALGERAARHLAAAGRRALARDDVPVAANLLGRAIDRLEASDPARADLALDWCEALLAAGEVGKARSAIDELGRFVEDKGLGNPLTPNPLRLRAWHTCFTGQLAVLTDPQALRATADAVAAAAEELAAAGDTAGEAKAHLVHALALSRLGKFGACEAELDKALAAARRGAHDRRRANTVLANAPLAALWGPSPVARASGRCLDVVRVLRITQGAPAVEAVALRCQAALEALRGRAEAARRMIASSRRMVEELGITQGLLETEMFAGLIGLIEGDNVAAEQSLRAAYEGLRSHGLGIDASRAAALLGIALLAQGRAAEAEALSHESEALAGDDLQAAITWRRVRAEALARRGERAAAVDFARAAVDIAAATDALLHHADARLALAAALHVAGRHDEAAVEEARAIELWEAKGATVLADRTRAGAGRMVEAEQAPGDQAAPRPAYRRVGANDATANAARYLTAIATGNIDAIAAVLADDLTVVHHPTSIEYDREGVLVSFRSLRKAREPKYELEPLATLGTSLALFRQSVSSLPRDELAIGAAERIGVLLMEVDAQGRQRHDEYFDADRLGDAVVRLYERHAELLPDAPERARAAATARSVAGLVGPLDIDRWAPSIAPDIDFVDHRTTGIGSVRGKEAFLLGFRSLLEVAGDIAYGFDDILELRSDALAVRQTNFGTGRAAGGTYERPFVLVWFFGADGLLARLEQFDLGHEAEALVRFDELTAEPSQARFAPTPFRAAKKSVRRIRPNTATANGERFEAMVAARDVDVLPTLCAEGFEVTDHTTGATYDMQGSLRSWRSMLRAEDLTYEHEPLATLGQSLALIRQRMSGTRAGGAMLDVGAWEIENVSLLEVDEHGRRRRAELFALERLGDAVDRLYERYAELLPDGPERIRAVATARSVAVLAGPIDLDRWATAIASGVETVDHRTLGLGSTRGAKAFLRGLGSLLEVADDVANRIDDVLALRTDVLLLRQMNSGTERVGGGAYERPFLVIRLFGADGLLTRLEWFDLSDEDEALARFDELTAEPSQARSAPAPLRAARKFARRVAPNAATAIAARFDAAVAARDLDAVQTLLSGQSETVDHTMGLVYDRAGTLTTWRRYFRAQDLSYGHEPLASLGSSLALFRVSLAGSGGAGGRFDVGAFEGENVHLIEVDAAGLRQRLEILAADRLGDAIVRLYERYAELLPDGPERDRAVATARTVATLPLVGPHNLDRFDAGRYAPAFEFVDHRTVGMGTVHGAEALRTAVRSLLDLMEDSTVRTEDVLALRPGGLLVRWRHFGTDRVSGGAFERLVCLLWVFGNDGLQTRAEQFDAECEAAALARFDELVAEPPAAGPSRRRLRANAATANQARTDAAIAARDAEALADALGDGYAWLDHTTGAEIDRPGMLASWRSLLRAQNPTVRHEALASLGDALALCRVVTSASGYTGRKLDVGAYEREKIVLIGVDPQGRRRRDESFAADHLGDAVVRLYERYAELLPDGAERDRAAGTARSIAARVGPFDFERYATVLAPGVEIVDHRILGSWSARGAEAMLQHYRSLLELADDVANRFDDILALRSDALLVRRTHSGTDRASGGAYERPFLVLWSFGTDGLATRIEHFDVGHEAEALARFDELILSPSKDLSPVEGLSAEPAPAARIENAATRTGDRFADAWAAHDWEAIAALFAPGHRVIDRRSYSHLDLDLAQHLESLRVRFEMRSSRYTWEVLATRGQRLDLRRWRFELADGDVGPSETESLGIVEIDEHGKSSALVAFDADDLDAAYAELDERYAAGEGAVFGRRTFSAFRRAATAGDWEAVAALLAPDFVVEDHSPLGWGTLDRAEYLDSLGALAALAPDSRVRTDHLWESDRGALGIHIVLGTREGGVFEQPRVTVSEVDTLGRERRRDIYNLDQLDEARARFAELSPDPPSTGLRGTGSLRIPPNAATRAFERRVSAAEAGDWEAHEAVYAPALVWDDRRPLIRTIGDRELLIANDRHVFTRGAQLAHRVLATAGDRLALQHHSWSAAADKAPFEIETLGLIEVDVEGRIVAILSFAPDDRRAASTEMLERYARSDEARCLPAAAFAAIHAVNDHDLGRLRATLHDDFVVDDHHRTGARLEGADDCVASIRSLFAAAPDFFTDNLYDVAAEKHAWLAIGRTSGTLAEGSEFESVFVRLMLFRGDRLAGLEQFELDHLEAARARFEELRG